MNTLRVILGDQLSPDVSALSDIDRATDTVLFMEVREEGEYVPHHPKKIIFILSAMRHFAAELREDGCRVEYIALDSPASAGGFSATLAGFVADRTFDRIVVTEPGEHRVAQGIAGWESVTGLPVEVREDDRFFVSRDDFAQWAEGRKQLLLENFYRLLRRRTGYLMNGRDPAGGKWNYDKENRKPAASGLDFPGPQRFAPDAITSDVIDLVRREFPERFGEPKPFWFVVRARSA